MKKKNFQKNPRQIVQGLTAAAMLFIAAQGEAQGQTLGDIVPTRIAGGHITRNSKDTGILSLDIGQVKATKFVGNGGEITGLNASQFTTGTLGSGVKINSSNDITTATKVQGSHLYSTGIIEAVGAITASNIFVQTLNTALPVKGTVWAGRVDADSFTIKGNALTATLNPKEAITISNNSNRNLPAINPRNSINIIGHKSGSAADDVASYGIFVNGIGRAPGDSRIQHKWNAEPDPKNGVTVLTKGNEDASMIDWKSNAATDADNWLEFKHFNGASKGLGTPVTWATHFALSQAGDATVSGNVSAKKFFGDGSGLKNLPMPVGIVSIQEVGQVRKLSFLEDVVDFGKDVFFKGANVSIVGNINLGASSDVVSPLRVKGKEFSELRLRAVNEAYEKDPVHSAVIQSHHNNNNPYISFGINDDVKMTMSRTNAILNSPLVITNRTDKVNLICGTGSFDTQNTSLAIHGIVHTETKHPLVLGANNFKRILIDPAGPTSIITENDGKFPTLSQSTKSLFGLTVTKGVLSEDVAISSKINWADYVFEKDYKLTSLEELEAFIKNNKHLPEITSESKIKEVGFYQVHDVLVGQLKNLEEQVLHNISQEKKLKLQQDQLLEQATKIANQQAQLDKLEAILNQFMNK